MVIPFLNHPLLYIYILIMTNIQNFNLSKGNILNFQNKILNCFKNLY